jgi:hypothetical protein
MSNQVSISKNKIVVFDCILSSGFWLFDLNRDGIKDLVAIGLDNDFKIALSSKATGTWVQTNKLWAASPPHVDKAGLGDSPIILFTDFNNDGLNDFFVFILGPLTYFDTLLPDGQKSGGFTGIPPQTFIASTDGTYKSSAEISNTYDKIVIKDFIPPSTTGYQINSNMSVKDASFADIDLDGDLDIWLESNGGTNIYSHFLINEGNGKWSVDIYNRLIEIGDPNRKVSNESWRFSQGVLTDINGDSFPDLILGQMRAHAWQQNEHSLIYLNDKKGFFPLDTQIQLPHPQFNDGWTKVVDLVAQDLNGDGRKDLVLLHIRYGSTTEEYKATSFIGEYVQLLYQDKNGKFIDQSWRLGDQSKLSQISPKPEQAQGLTISDINADGSIDIALKYNWDVKATDLNTPWLYLQNSYGAFEKVDPFFYTGGEKWFGENAIIEDIDGDGVVEIVSTDLLPGKDGVYNTEDEFSSIVVSYFSTSKDFKSIPQSRYPFQDRKIALDLEGNAGTTAKILGAVFGKESLNNKNYVGIGLHFLDTGWSYDNLAALALDAAGAKTNDQVVSLLWSNVIGTKPTAADKQPFIALLENGMSAGALAHLAADSIFNTININLVGLAQTGIEYLPVS